MTTNSTLDITTITIPDDLELNGLYQQFDKNFCSSFSAELTDETRGELLITIGRQKYGELVRFLVHEDDPKLDEFHRGFSFIGEVDRVYEKRYNKNYVLYGYRDDVFALQNGQMKFWIDIMTYEEGVPFFPSIGDGHWHFHKCSWCGGIYAHQHGLDSSGRNHVQFKYQCPNYDCEASALRGDAKRVPTGAVVMYDIFHAVVLQY